MTEATKVDGSIQTKRAVRMIFSNVNEASVPKGVKGNPEPKFGGTFILEKDIADELIRRAADVAKANWPGRSLKELAFPFVKSEKEAATAVAKGKDASIYPEGTYVFRAKSKYAPELYIRNGKRVDSTQAGTPVAKSKFYSGCWVVVHVNFVAYNGIGNNPDGVTAYLQAALWDHDDTRVGGSVGAGAFNEYVGAVSSEDPTGGAGSLDDEISF